jgi:hypothetical protein
MAWVANDVAPGGSPWSPHRYLCLAGVWVSVEESEESYLRGRVYVRKHEGEAV